MARPSNGAHFTVPELERLLTRKMKAIAKLGRKRDTLQRRLDALDREIRDAGGGVRGMGRARLARLGGGRKRARNDRSLVDVMHEVMSKKAEPMRVQDIADAAQSAGYRSNSANFRSIVNQMLIKERKRFHNTGRGLYQVKK